MKILVTGAAGFIGFFVSKKLIEKGHQVVGLDNINDYYKTNLKYDRLKELGISREDAEKFGHIGPSKTHPDSFSFIRLNLEDREALPELFKDQKFDVVCNLAAQAGVRYSLENPESYIDSNIVGFLNVLECCRQHNIKHLVYASSSSVYGLNKLPIMWTTPLVCTPLLKKVMNLWPIRMDICTVLLPPAYVSLRSTVLGADRIWPCSSLPMPYSRTGP